MVEHVDVRVERLARYAKWHVKAIEDEAFGQLAKERTLEKQLAVSYNATNKKCH